MFKYNIIRSFSTFSSLPLISVLRILSGLFMLSIFPGWVFLRVFYRANLCLFEKIGLVLALSYCINAIIGLSLIRLNYLSSLSYMAFVMIFVSLTVILAKFSRRHQTLANPVSSKPAFSWEKIMLALRRVDSIAWKLQLSDGRRTNQRNHWWRHS